MESEEFERDCIEVLDCPGCHSADVDFDFLAYRLVRCSLCGVSVRITNIKAFIGPPGEPTDWVTLEGSVA